EDGQFLWQEVDSRTSPLSLWSPQAPVRYGDLIVAGFPSGALKAFRPGNGEVVWQETFHATPVAAEALNDVKSYQATNGNLLASSYSGNLRAWSSTAGSKKLIWSKDLSVH